MTLPLVAATRVRAVFEAHKGRYGAPRVDAELRMGEKFPFGRHRVARLMRKFGMVARPRRRVRGTTTDADHDLPVAESLLQREFSVLSPKMAVVGDITHLPTRAGWVYLAVLIDLYRRKVVAWAIETTWKPNFASVPSTVGSPHAAIGRALACTTTAAPSTRAVPTVGEWKPRR